MRKKWVACFSIALLISILLIWYLAAFKNLREHARHIILNSNDPEEIFEALSIISLKEDSFILQIATDKLHEFDGTAIQFLLPHLQSSNGLYYQYLVASIEYFSRFPESSRLIEVLYKRIYNEKFTKNHIAIPMLVLLVRNHPYQFFELLSEESDASYRIFLSHELFCNHQHSFHYRLNKKDYKPLFTSHHTDLRSLATTLTLHHEDKGLPQDFLIETLKYPYDIHILSILSVIDKYDYSSKTNKTRALHYSAYS